MMEWVYVPFILVVIYYSLYFYFKRTFSYWKNRNVPGPEPLTFYGNVKESVRRTKNLGEIFSDLYAMYPNEKVIGIYRTITPNLLIRDLDLIKQIMIKDFDKFMDRGVEFSKEGLGANLFHADGDTWRNLRSQFTPMFTSGKLKNMFYLMDDRAKKLLNYLEKETCINSEQEVRNLVQKYTIDSITACAFGLDVDTYDTDNLDDFKRMDKLILEPNLAFDLEMAFPGIMKKLNFSFFPKFVINYFNSLVKNVITQRNGKPTSRNDFMDLILELRQKGQINTTKFGDDQLFLDITDDVIAAQAFVFYVAGYETSTTTMTYLLHELAVNPHIQEKLIAEIDEVLNNNDIEITYNTLKEMKYLEKVFSETLRKHPIIDPLQRMAREDYKLPGTDVVIPKGQLVFVTPRGIHHDEKYYPNPEEFDPERFSPEEMGKRHPCAYMPFGVGPRNCIGMRFGQIQSRLLITHLLSKYRIEPSPRTVKKLLIEPNRLLIGPKDGVYVNIIPRN